MSRRQFLVAGGAAAGAVLLGACGDDGGGSATSTTAGPTGGDLSLAPFFGGPMFAAGQEVRAPFGVADIDGLLSVDDSPGEVAVTVSGPDGEPVDVPGSVARHAEGLARAYFPLRFTPAAAGIYTVRAEIDGEGAEMSFRVDEPADIKAIRPGDALPALETPTVDDPRGVTPICTNDPVCPLHAETLAEALDDGAPIALLVATPAFCQVRICGPVLDVLLGAVEDHPEVRFLHAEVYADPANDPKLARKAPVVGDLGLHFEPVLVLAGSDGIVTERLDVIYDTVELDGALGRLSGVDSS